MQKLTEEANTLEFGLAKHFREYDLRLVQQRMEFNASMEEHLKQSREQNLKEFRS